MKLIFVFIILLFIVAFGAMGYYLYSLRQQGGVTPASIQNPFRSPAQSFGQTTTPVVNPFASPTPTTYQNPFSTQSSSSPSYQNPFEKLR